MPAHDHQMPSHDKSRSRLELVRAAVDTVISLQSDMTLTCLRTHLALCAAVQDHSQGMGTLALASLLDTPRTNVTRHLKFLRERGLVETTKHPADSRVDLNRPTEAGVALCDFTATAERNRYKLSE